MGKKKGKTKEEKVEESSDQPSTSGVTISLLSLKEESVKTWKYFSLGSGIHQLKSKCLHTRTYVNRLLLRRLSCYDRFTDQNSLPIYCRILETTNTCHVRDFCAIITVRHMSPQMF